MLSPTDTDTPNRRYDWTSQEECERFWRDFYRGAAAVVGKRVGDPERRHDIVNDALVSIINEAPDYVTWSYVRKRLGWESAHQFRTASARNTPCELDTLGEEPAMPSPTPERQAELAEALSWAQSVITDVVRLRRIEGRSARDVAAILGLPSEGSVHTHVSRWEARHRELSDGYFGSGDQACATLFWTDGRELTIPMQARATRIERGTPSLFTTRLQLPERITIPQGSRAFLTAAVGGARHLRLPSFELHCTSIDARDPEGVEVCGEPHVDACGSPGEIAVVTLSIVVPRVREE